MKTIKRGGTSNSSENELDLSNSSEKELMKHYRDYPRRSPPFKQTEPFDVVYDDHNRNIDHTFPTSVILTVAMHGRTKEPFITPVNVVRYISTDFGTKSYRPSTMNGDKIRGLMFDGFNDEETLTNGGNIIETVLMQLASMRLQMAERHKIKTRKSTKGDGRDSTDVAEFLIQLGKERAKHNGLSENDDGLDYAGMARKHLATVHAFLQSKFHDRPKRIKKNLPMFNKSYSAPNEFDNHSIFVRANLSTAHLKNKDLYLEIHTTRTTLQEILTFLASHGVTDVTLIDLSCQGDKREKTHRKRYGGRVT